jgi:hypothetical protein
MNVETGGNIARRYPMSLAIKYVIDSPESARTGVGETVWMNSRQMAFLAKEPAGVGDKLMMRIEWPVLLRGEVPLQLIVSAEIVQLVGPLSIARLSRHEFRTRRLQSSSMDMRSRPALPAWAPYPTPPMPAARAMATVPQPGPYLVSAAGG